MGRRRRRPASAGQVGRRVGPLPPTSGQLLVSHLLDLFVRRRLFAEEVCVAMHHAADKFEEAKPYALRPGLASGKYSGHLKQMLGYTRDNTLLYDLSMPGKLKGSAAGVNMDTFVMPGHELIQEDWQSNFDDYAVRLQELVDDRALPPRATTTIQ